MGFDPVMLALCSGNSGGSSGGGISVDFFPVDIEDTEEPVALDTAWSYGLNKAYLNGTKAFVLFCYVKDEDLHAPFLFALMEDEGISAYTGLVRNHLVYFIVEGKENGRAMMQSMPAVET